MFSKSNYTSAISLIIIFISVYWSISSLMPKTISNLETKNTEFSTERALLQLKEISKKPHYVGSENHKEVREYIISELEKLGLTVEVQTQMALNKKWRAGTEAKNIIAKIKGSENGKALLLLSHYDSAPPHSFGASDAGSGVVTILEGVRAYLANNPNPKNDIIILITDAEELGLLGANAFVNHHPWAKNVGLVLNFEARGSGGPSYMLLETNGGNKKLIKAFNKANVDYPVSNSLLYSIYKSLPNDTDLTVFREDGNINGYNFAFIDDHFDYHTSQDTFERLDRNTLEHQGTYLMPLLKYFANANLEKLSDQSDYVFFNFPGFDLVNYPFSWVFPMAIIALIWFIVLLIIGLVKQKITILPILKGLGIFLITIIIAGLLSYFGWVLLLKIYPQYNDILHGFTYNGHYYITAFVALSLGICFLIFRKSFKKQKTVNLIIGPIILWTLINILIALYLPGAGFFIIPLITILLILSYWILFNKHHKNHTVWYSILAIPSLLILIPMIQMFPVGLGLKMLVVSGVFTVLLFGILIPVFASFKEVKGLTKLFFLIAVLSFVSAGFSSKKSNTRKQPNSILYVLNADKNEAYWASYNQNIDAYLKQFLGENPSKGSFVKNASASKYGSNFKMYKKAKILNFKEPLIEILEDTITNSLRKIHLRIIPQRKVNRLDIKSTNTVHFKSFSLNGETLKIKNGDEFVFTTEKSKHILSYYITKEGEVLDIKITTPKGEKPVFEIQEASFDLLTNSKIKELVNIKPRTETMMPMPFVLNDVIIVKKQIEL